MKNCVQKSLAVLLLFLSILFTSCGSAPSETPGSNEANKPLNTDGLFKQSVSYNSHSPAKDIALPSADGQTILSHTQIEKTLYMIDGSTAYSLNIETGESAMLFNTSADSIVSYGDTLYLLGSQRGEVSSYSTSGEKLDSFVCESLRGIKVLGYESTDNYLVVLGYFQGSSKRKIITLSKESKTVETEIEVKSDYNNICPYTKDKVFITYISDGSDKLLYTLDAVTGKFERQRKILTASSQSDCIGICYNSNANSVILAVPFGAEKISLIEYQLDNEDNTVLARFDRSEGTLSFGSRRISAYENIISVLSDSNSYQHFDYNNPPQYITIAYNDSIGGSSGSNDLEKIIANYESEHDVIVRTIVYSEDLGRLQLDRKSVV